MLTSEVTPHRYFIELAFNGSGYKGWQVQPGMPTVQDYLNRAITTLIAEPVNLVGCGRTDSGVHASHFIAHFDTVKPIRNPELVTRRLRRYLNPSVRVDRIVEVASDVNARFNAISRIYHYLINSSRSPWFQEFSWNLTVPLDVAAMNEGASRLLGTHDFTSFSKLHTDVKTNICTVAEAEWFEREGFLVFRIRADRFLRNMVRAIVGTSIEIGKGKAEPLTVGEIMLAKDRSRAGTSVPASGLFLTRVDYHPDDFIINPVSPFPFLISVL
ncbi:MAG: tRNA pseudouridine(38-40) synthase TruA [Bacteroidota bacterium]